MKRAFVYIILALYLLASCTSGRTLPDAPAPSQAAGQIEADQPSEAEEAPEVLEPPAVEDPEPEPEPEAAPEAEVTYILNKNTKKFHKPACRSAELISPKNYEETCGSREEVLALGYTPCGNCRP